MDQPGHPIRLRGGWEWHQPDAPDVPSRRLALPTVWTAEAGAAARLVRRFNRPPIDNFERVILVLDHVPGLVAARLNEVDVATGAEIESLLGATNRLILDVDLTACACGMPWGEVALVIVGANPIGDGGAGALS